MSRKVIISIEINTTEVQRYDISPVITEQEQSILKKKSLKKSFKEIGSKTTFFFAPMCTPVNISVFDDAAEEQDDYGSCYTKYGFGVDTDIELNCLEESKEEFTEGYDDKEEAELEWNRYNSLFELNKINSAEDEGLQKTLHSFKAAKIAYDDFVVTYLKNSIECYSKKVSKKSLAKDTKVIVKKTMTDWSYYLTYEIELEDGEEFDIQKFRFLCLDAEADNCHKLISSINEDSTVIGFLNAIHYKDKVYPLKSFDDFEEDDDFYEDAYETTIKYELLDKDLKNKVSK